MEFNKWKNRYTNILTCKQFNREMHGRKKIDCAVCLDDHSRVKLTSDDRDGRGNYINANYVDVNIRSNEG